jgi:hypothetical protein
MAVWHSLCPFGILFPFWYVWTRENLATLPPIYRIRTLREHKGVGNYCHKNVIAPIFSLETATGKNMTVYAHFLIARNAVQTRVARFFLVHDTKTGKNVPNEYKMNQMVLKYPKSP